MKVVANKFTTSITMPRDVWELLQKLVAQRKVQGEKASLNSIMVEAFSELVPQWRLELEERIHRR
jgi:hypothetical protein